MVDDRSRRIFLASLSTVLAGCSRSQGTPRSDRRTGTPDETQSGLNDRSPSPERTDSTPTRTLSQSESPSNGVEQLAADDPALAWAVQISGPIASSPAVDTSEDHVYVGMGTQGTGTPVPGRTIDNGGVFALGPSDGTLVWQATTMVPVVHQPILLDGRIHVVTGNTNGYGGDNQRIVAYDGDGSELWTTQRRDSLISIVTANDGTVFAGTSDDEIGGEGQSVFAVDPDGNVRWERGGGDAMGGIIADGLLLYDAGGRAIVAYDVADGAIAWEVNGDPIGSGSSRIASFDGLCFTQSPDETDDGHALVAHSTADGNEQWRYYSPARRSTNFSIAGVSNVPQSIAGASDERQLVGVDFGGTVFSLRAGDGHERWTFTADATARDPPVVGDAIYASDVGGNVYALSPDDGSEQWRATLPRLPQLQPLSDGVVAISDSGNGRTVASFDGNGTERWRFSTSRDLHQPTVVGNQVYACASDGTVFSFVTSVGE